MGEFSWFFEYLNSSERVEERLEEVHDTSRGLGLTVVAMCDLATKFGVPITTELSRIYFQFMLYMCLMKTMEDGCEEAMLSKFFRVYRSMRASKTDNDKIRPFFSALNEGIRRCHTRIAVR